MLGRSGLRALRADGRRPRARVLTPDPAGSPYHRRVPPRPSRGLGGRAVLLPPTARPPPATLSGTPVGDERDGADGSPRRPPRLPAVRPGRAARGARRGPNSRAVRRRQPAPWPTGQPPRGRRHMGLCARHRRVGGVLNANRSAPHCPSKSRRSPTDTTRRGPQPHPRSVRSPHHRLPQAAQPGIEWAALNQACEAALGAFYGFLGDATSEGDATAPFCRRLDEHKRSRLSPLQRPAA